MQRIKKVMASVASGLMAGATLMAPVLAEKTIGEAFNEMTPDNTVVVVGANAKTSDVVAAIAIGAKIGQHGATAEAATATEELEGVEEDEYAIYETVNMGMLDDNDLAGLMDTTIDWNDETIDVREIVKVTNVAVMSSETDEDFGSEIVLGTNDLYAITYYVEVDDNDYNNDLVTEDDPLEIKVAGKSLKIIDVKDLDTTDSLEITYESGIEKVMSPGDTVEVEGKTVKVTDIGENTVVVEVDGQSEFIDLDETSEVGNTGIKVEVKSILYNGDNPSMSKALLRIGSDIRKSVKDGDSAELFGEPEDEDDAEWVWYIKNSTANDIEIGLTFNQKYDSDTEPVKKVGEAFELPEGYVKVQLYKLTVKDDNYVKIKGYFDDGIKVKYDENGNSDTTWLSNYDDVKAFVLEADKDIFKVKIDSTTTNWEETDKIYLIVGDGTNHDALYAFKNKDGDVQVFALDSADGGINATTGELEIEYDDTSYALTIDASGGTAGEFKVTFDESTGVDTSDIVIDQIDVTNKKLGPSDNDAEAGELYYGTTDISSREKDVRTKWGTIVKEPETYGDKDEVELLVPNDQVKAVIRVYGPSSSVTTVTGEGSVSFKPVTADMAKLDSEVSSADKSSKNIVLVGGPAINSLVAELANAGKTLSLEQWRAEYQNKAIVQVIEDAFASGRVALVVAGYEAQDTRNAAAALLTGKVDNYKAALISGDTVTEFTMPAAAAEEEEEMAGEETQE